MNKRKNDANGITDGFKQQSRELADVLPLPSVLESYAEVDPKFIPELIEMVKKEQQHRHIMEKKLIRSQSYSTRIGQLLSFALVIIIGYLAIAFVADGFLFLAGLTIVSGFSFLLTVNLVERTSRDKGSAPAAASDKHMPKQAKSSNTGAKNYRYHGKKNIRRKR